MHINPTIIYGYDDFLGCRKVLKGCWGIEKRGDRFEEENIETYSWFLLHTKKKKLEICTDTSYVGHLRFLLVILYFVVKIKLQ